MTLCSAVRISCATFFPSISSIVRLSSFFRGGLWKNEGDTIAPSAAVFKSPPIPSPDLLAGPEETCFPRCRDVGWGDGTLPTCPALRAAAPPSCRPTACRRLSGLLRRSGKALLFGWLFCLCAGASLPVRAEGPAAAVPAPAEEAAPRSGPAATSKAGESAVIAWEEQDGLAFAELPLPLPEGPGPRLAVVRLPPENFDFVLCAVGRGKHPPLTLRQWAQREGWRPPSTPACTCRTA